MVGQLCTELKEWRQEPNHGRWILEKAELTLFILVCTSKCLFLSLIVLVPKVELPSKTAKLFFVSYYIISNSSFVVLSVVAAVVVV